MANALYANAKEQFLQGGIDLLNDDIKVVLVDTDLYTADTAADDFLDDIASGARVATSANLSGKTVTDGVFDADDVTFTAVTGAESEAVVIYKDTGVAATSPLIAYIDTGTGLPITPNTGDIILQWSGSLSKIFAL
jgi:hypothetical protein